MRTYFILTTTNSRIEGWEIIGKTANKKEAVELADKLKNSYLEPNESGNVDIYDQTRAKNIRVLSKTKVLRNGFLHRSEI